MRPFFFIIFVSAVILLFGLIEVALLRTLNREWWQRRWIRRAAWGLPVLGIGFFVLFALAEYHNIGWLGTLGSIVAATTLILEVALMFTLPVSGIIHFLARLIERLQRRRTGDAPTDYRRRLFLQGAAAAVPAAAVAVGLGGVGRALGSTVVEQKQFHFTQLPPALSGIRILHLSDLHLGHYVTLEHLENTLTDAAAFNPDLILFTGDIADDLTQLPEALRLIENMAAPLGAYACPGNHEHFRGMAEVEDIFAASSIPFLVNRGLPIELSDRRLYVAAIDDPVAMHSVAPDYYSRAIAIALHQRPEQAFTILMSHRPDAFPDAAARGIPLTLAGHTHGAQVGFMHRSLLESSFPDKYLWGRYRLDESHLYTSCGSGHWFPFRLGCPQEAPIIELVRV